MLVLYSQLIEFTSQLPKVVFRPILSVKSVGYFDTLLGCRRRSLGVLFLHLLMNHLYKCSLNNRWLVNILIHFFVLSSLNQICKSATTNSNKLEFMPQSTITSTIYSYKKKEGMTNLQVQKWRGIKSDLKYTATRTQKA